MQGQALTRGQQHRPPLLQYHQTPSAPHGDPDRPDQLPVRSNERWKSARTIQLPLATGAVPLPAAAAPAGWWAAGTPAGGKAKPELAVKN